ncbi:glycosyltransferase [Vibrio sp. S/42/10]|uniref:glycosyltransferase n=1 Tax=Vibrio sp. S/42/10 TaxID=2914757 RepID=UPI002469B2A8|nr:glycosyltransferase [Vibrio sp. S/42/10]MDH5881664.1 glycosyltransferase [Vibrio sp. S/42/10]
MHCKTKENIAFFIPSFFGGGAERVIVNLANEISKRGVKQVFIFCNRKNGPYLKDVSDNVEIIEINAVITLFSFIKLRRLILDKNITVICSTLRSCNISSAIVKLMLGKKVHWIAREANTFESIDKVISKEYVIRVLCKLAYRYADKVIANSDDTKNTIIKEIGIQPNKIFVIHNPVTNRCYDKHITDGNILKIINVGRLVEQKNQSELVKVAIELINVYRFNNFKISIYGEGIEKDNICRLIDKHNVSEHVEVCDFTTDITEKYRESDLFVLCSKWEGFGNVIVEALSCGVPVFSYNCPGGPKEIINDDVGRLFDMSDVSKLSRNIINLYYKELSFDVKKLHDRANDFSINKISSRYLEVMFDE